MERNSRKLVISKLLRIKPDRKQKRELGIETKDKQATIKFNISQLAREYPSSAPFFGSDVSKAFRSRDENGSSAAIRNAIRRRIYSFVLKHEAPIVTDIFMSKEFSDYPLDVLHGYLRDLSFTLINDIGVVKEKKKIIIWRSECLRNIRDFRQEGKKIYYLSQTVMNQPHGSANVKDQRPITILHIGSESGFVEGGPLVIEKEEDMNSETFEKWFAKILHNLEWDSVIVMDHPSWKSELFDKPPTKLSSKQEMQMWLHRHNISYEDDMLKIELLDMINKRKPLANSCIADRMAEETGRTVLKLPPFHTELTPAELIWAKIHRDVSDKIMRCGTYNVKNDFLQAMRDITADHWSSAVLRVIEEELRIFVLDQVMESVMDPFMMIYYTKKAGYKDCDD